LSLAIAHKLKKFDVIIESPIGFSILPSSFHLLGDIGLGIALGLFLRHLVEALDAEIQRVFFVQR
jgi:hypothetical protein